MDLENKMLLLRFHCCCSYDTVSCNFQISSEDQLDLSISKQWDKTMDPNELPPHLQDMLKKLPCQGNSSNLATQKLIKVDLSKRKLHVRFVGLPCELDQQHMFQGMFGYNGSRFPV